MYLKKTFGVMLLCAPIILLLGGCACHKGQSYNYARAEAPAVSRVAELLPPDAKEGECYVKVFVPEKFETYKETVCVREATERLETIPAKYEWVEEKVLIKDASTVLVPVPPEFTWKEQTVQTEPGHTGWHVSDATRSANDPQNLASKDMYCLVKHQPRTETVRTQVVSKPATTREEIVPAEYQTIRRQKLVSPATTRRIVIPAEFATIEKFRKIEDSRMEWQLVNCEMEGGPRDSTVMRDPVAMRN